MMKHISILLLLVLLLTVGCGKSAPKVYEVKGVVTYQGKPLPTGTVMFIPDNPGAKAAISAIDANGNYRLETVEGSHSVQVQMIARLRGQSVAGEGGGINMPEVDWLIPEKYGNFQESGLEATVTAGGENKIDFPLQ